MPDDIADLLRERIKASGLAPTEIAKVTGIPQPTIFRIVNGTQQIKSGTASKLLQYFGVELKETETCEARKSLPTSGKAATKKRKKTRSSTKKVR